VPACVRDDDEVRARERSGLGGNADQLRLTRDRHDEDPEVGHVAQAQLEIRGLEGRRRSTFRGRAGGPDRRPTGRIAEHRRMADAGASKLEKDEVALRIVAELTHQLDRGPGPSRAPRDLRGEAGSARWC